MKRQIPTIELPIVSKYLLRQIPHEALRLLFVRKLLKCAAWFCPHAPPFTIGILPWEEKAGENTVALSRTRGRSHDSPHFRPRSPLNGLPLVSLSAQSITGGRHQYKNPFVRIVLRVSLVGIRRHLCNFRPTKMRQLRSTKINGDTQE